MSKPQTIEVFGLEFEYTVGETSTVFLLPTGDTKTFPNWDVKMVTERYYRSEYIEGPPDHEAAENSRVRGIAPADVIRFIRYNRPLFEELLAPMLDDVPDDGPIWKRAKKAGI